DDPHKVRGVWPPPCPPAQGHGPGPTSSSLSVPHARRVRMRTSTVGRKRARGLQVLTRAVFAP
ncbi:hypothetical protein MC885_009812, partial [Smutsia gigantea]